MHEVITTFLFPLLYLIIATLIGGEIVRRLYSPKVKVKLRESNYKRNKEGFLIALDIVNIGSTMATQCISYLIIDNQTEIQKKDLLFEHEACEDEYLPTYSDENNDYSVPRKQWITPDKYVIPKRLVLCWNHAGDPYQLDINPGMTVSLNICRMRYHNDSWYIIFPTEKGWRSVRLRMWFKKLKGKIFICPSNTYPLIANFEIVYDQIKNEPVFHVGKIISRFKRKKTLLKY